MIALVGGSALVGERLERVDRATVLIADEVIAEVGPQAEVVIPVGAQTIDLSGMTLAPGFIDAHVHIAFVDPAEVLRGGVTTVRDLGWPPEEIHPVAARSRDVAFAGPEILAAGPILTAAGGYPTRAAWAPPGTGREVADEDAVAMVARTVREGATIIKVALDPRVGPTFSLGTLTAIVRAAHDLGLKVTGHVCGLGELGKALDAGMDELAHMLMSNERIPTATLDRMVTSGTAVVPTLSIRSGSELATAVENLARFRAAGGRVVYGTDLGNEGPRPGIDPLEVTALSDAGFTPLDIIRSATVDSADRLDLHDRGLLNPGKLADIVAFDEPLRDVAGLTKVGRVWRRGVLRSG